MRLYNLLFLCIFKFFHKLSIIFIFFLIDLDFSHANPLKISTWASMKTGKSFESINLVKPFGISFENENNTLSSRFQLNLLDNNTFSLDESYLNYNIRNTNIGVGKLNRQWSFSPKTSLILSSHARPSNSVYINIKNENKNKFFSWMGPTSFEVFNSVLSNKNGPQNTMLLGARFELHPINNLKFELLKTSQWGGDGNPRTASALKATILGNTNENKHANVNQLAGLGATYTIPSKFAPIRIYGQAIGEDEAGGLPMCFMYLFGLETITNISKFPYKLGFEIVDTRINFSTNKNCGPNTAYNNNTYKYSNYNENLGAFIGTEGRSISMWGKSKINQKINLDYSLNHILINDTNWLENPLSDTRQLGWSSSLKITWEYNSYKFHSQIDYQDFSLIKKGVEDGLHLNMGIKYIF